ncbi:N-acetylmuramoyl-L-alanine amidase [Mycoplasmatota bacterium]|nr:N-acetylmuramoyl-L-alanine amidase [Mycoplasmatota bacterium]
MGKKYQFTFTILFIILTILTIQITLKTNSTLVEKASSSNISQETTENTITEAVWIDNITFDAGIKINEIMPYKSDYIAIGQEDNTPFMQLIHVENDEVINKGFPYLFTEGTGEVVDITIHDYFITTTIDNNDSIITQDFIEYNDHFIPFYKKQIQYNYDKDLTINPKYLVIHETANTGIGADADAHYRYWNSNPTANASTHFVVDSTQIYQMLELNQAAWHVGDNHNHSDITNLNSIGIEVAVNEDGDFSEARQNAIELTIHLMKTLNMDISQLKRHYDASGKNCPTNMLQQPELWNDFVQQVEQALN